VLDNDLWLKDDGGTFPEKSADTSRDHPRRLVTPSHAWSSNGSGLGDHAYDRAHLRERQTLLFEADRKWAEVHLDDVRVIDTDPFITPD
jgi:hypothetical protein